MRRRCLCRARVLAWKSVGDCVKPWSMRMRRGVGVGGGMVVVVVDILRGGREREGCCMFGWWGIDLGREVIMAWRISWRGKRWHCECIVVASLLAVEKIA